VDADAALRDGHGPAGPEERVQRGLDRIGIGAGGGAGAGNALVSDDCRGRTAIEGQGELRAARDWPGKGDNGAAGRTADHVDAEELRRAGQAAAEEDEES